MQIDVDEAAALLSDATLIILRPEETRPRIVSLFHSEEDLRRMDAWLTTQPHLQELLEHAQLLALARSIELSQSEVLIEQIAEERSTDDADVDE